MIRRVNIPFENRMTRAQRILGWIYLAVHVFVLPELLALYASFSPDPLSNAALNAVYYGVGVVISLTVMHSFLRGSFDVLVDNLRRCLLAILLGLLIDYALSGVVSLVLTLLEETVANPNNEAILTAAQTEPGVKALTIFIVPIVEEVLFRGVAFGSIRTRSRGWAYLVSAALFSLYHIWRYALPDPGYWIYALQYLPISVVLAWIYERSGSIWPGIFFHMGINAMSFYVLNLLQNL